MDQNNNFQPQQAPQQPYTQQPPVSPETKNGSPLGIVSLIFGILGIIFCWVGCTCTSVATGSYVSNGMGGAVFGWIVFAVSAIGLVLAIVGLKVSPKGKTGLCVAGLVLCILGMLFSLIGAACASCMCQKFNSTYGALYNAANDLANLFDF